MQAKHTLVVNMFTVGYTFFSIVLYVLTILAFLVLGVNMTVQPLGTASLLRSAMCRPRRVRPETRTRSATF